MMHVIIILAGGVLFAFAFGMLGNLPPTPAGLELVADQLIQYMAWIINIMDSILIGHLFFGSMAVVSAVMLWEPIYYSIMWVLKKIPVLGIK